MTPPVKIIIDTDIGDDVDDAIAIAWAARRPELDIRAVTTGSPTLCTSSTEARVMRTMIASGIVASATAGSTRCANASAAASNSPVSKPSTT